jgi:hypothetical protein
MAKIILPPVLVGLRARRGSDRAKERHEHLA